MFLTHLARMKQDQERRDDFGDLDELLRVDPVWNK